eukprot:GILK01009195.1.p1 GENE.GILK01009195.1~~GILK01009195.1.p1  ORF type:complete len:122 (-),score=9.63 GILK01009195.1:280-645(-)
MTRFSDEIQTCAVTQDVQTIISLLKHESPLVRLAALKQVCPCRVKADIDAFWDQVITMTNDSDARVRAQVLHTLCDGSPAHREQDVADALEVFNRDTDKYIRRRAHKVLASYTRHGKWNIL